MIDETTILSISLDEAWVLFKIKLYDLMENKDSEGNQIEPILVPEDYDAVRFGIKIDFEIDDHFERVFRKKPKSGTIVINKKEYSLKDYRTEIEERERIIRGALLELYNKENDTITMG